MAEINHWTGWGGVGLLVLSMAACPSPRRHAQPEGQASPPNKASSAKVKTEAKAPDIPSKGPLAQKIYYEQAKGLLQGGRLDEALLTFRRAISAHEGGKLSANCYLGLGSTLSEMDKKEAAVDAYRKVVELSPRDPDAYRALAIGLEEVGKLEEAASNLRQSLELDPDQLTAYQDLAALFLQRKEPAKAQEVFLAYEKRRATLIKILGLSKEVDQREAAAALLGQARDESTAKALGLALSDGDDGVRLAVIYSLGQQGLKAGVGPLRALLKRSKDDQERKAIKQSLEAIAAAKQPAPLPAAKQTAPSPAAKP